MLRFSIAVFLAVLAFCAVLQSQTPSRSPVQLTTGEIVESAAGRSRVYLDTFRNLLSEEKKTFETFDKKGEVKNQKSVDSTFIVYQLSKDEGQIAEYRNVIGVDGRKLDKTDDRAQDFFEKVVNSGSSRIERERIQDESTRYDGDLVINGLTLFQAVALSEPLRASFRFRLIGKELVGGNEMFVLEYHQIAPNRFVTVNAKRSQDTNQISHNYDIDIDDEEIELNPRIRGKMWIDASTFNLRREVRERSVQPLGFTKPMVVAENIFEYTDSEFGILTPKKISHLQYRVKVKEQLTLKEARITFEYGKFTKPDVEVKSADVNERPKPN